MSDCLRFVLDGEVRELRSVDPTLTVLNYLRGVERRCGTKEGCAEGDCGACTVVLSEPAGDGLSHRAVNACILFLPALDGKALTTVESLGAGGGLHPVQRAMVECHASQCGFCTPGFVMSLYALYESEAGPPTRPRIDDVLAGNLCRCTGYRPIVAAAERAYAYGEPRDGAAAARTAALLRSIAREDTLALEHDGRRFFAPRTLDALAALVMRYPEAHLLAGGTDLGLLVTKQHRRLDTLIYVGGVGVLGGIAVTGTHLEIGAAVAYADAEVALAARYEDFGALLRRLGSVQVRNLGTIGGNIANASPIGDTPPALIALGASLVLRQETATRELPLDDFFLDYRKTALAPGEFIERVRVPLPTPERRFRTYKVAKRFDQDISAVCGAFSLVLERGRVADIRLCYGGMAATPTRALACERALIGRNWTEASVAAALPVLDDCFAPLSDMRASAGYRRLVARNLLRKFQLETAGRPGATRLTAAERVPA
jgi:xanthine dehydrogenase small subunit